MSRKGKMPIPLPAGVQIDVQEDLISVKGPKGQLQGPLMSGFTVEIEGDQILVFPQSWRIRDKNFYGLTRALIANMVEGVSRGFEKKLELIGVGYRAAIQGDMLDVQVGKSHPTQLSIPSDLQVRIEKNTQVSVTGVDKQKVGQFAANLRSMRRPEPYQGKGIRYLGERVRRKAGKSSGKGKK